MLQQKIKKELVALSDRGSLYRISPRQLPAKHLNLCAQPMIKSAGNEQDLTVCSTSPPVEHSVGIISASGR